jgi:hypothetical protein
MSLLLIQLGLKNVRLNLSFVKDIPVPGKKMATNDHKMAIYESQNFSLIFLQNCKKLEAKTCDLCHSF